MLGVILAGGLGTRLMPLTLIINKHLLPVYDRPMIFYPIQTLVKAGIKDIVVVTGGPHAGNFIHVLRDGKDLGIEHLYYAYQAQEGGIAQALSCAEPYCRGKKVAVILGDNCTDAEIAQDVQEFTEGARIFLKKVPDPERFGVPAFDGEGRITKIIEKPASPPSDFAVTGLYLYDETVFDRIKDLKPSARGEFEVTDLNNSYLRDGNLEWVELQGFWKDAGTFETLFEVGAYWRSIKVGKERE